MRAIMILLLSTITSFSTFGQILKPVKWEFEVLSVDNGLYELKATAKMDDKWAIYSQHTGEGGPIPLEFSYEEGVVLEGDTKEVSEAIRKMSKLFEIEVIKFEKEAIFTQKFKPKNGQSSIKGTLTFMCCDDLRCLPPTDVAFDVAF
ncbi:MAG: protein-disulfide reductase DsbD family protein [Saprospiraceae bacterium]|nr:protein-disulfide reductase DsbD family protein [Saprospiraceae bacterium]